jgi:ectoine hydroxylase-related dioxygenase (phytanoyl-CoA dioxygenase family)
MIELKDRVSYSEKIIKEHEYLIQTRGYNVFPDFYSDEECEYLKLRLHAAVESYVPSGTDRSFKDKYLLHDLMVKDLSFSKTLEDPRLQQVIAAVLGEFWIMYAYTSSSLPPHGDNYGSRIHTDAPRNIPNYPTNLGLLWALNDFTIENGATKLLPASHHSATIPTEEFFEKNSTQILCKKGSLLVFDARVFHRAGNNQSDTWRHSLTMNVCRPYMKQRMDWVRFIPVSIADQLNAQARRILGYDTRLPSSLEEFFVTDDKRLYKPNQE